VSWLDDLVNEGSVSRAFDHVTTAPPHLHAKQSFLWLPVTGSAGNVVPWFDGDVKQERA
jgi:hypothetical protein